MLTKKERMEKLNNAGVETGKYFTFELPEGLDAGTKIHLVIDESGVPKVVNENANDYADDPIYNQILEDGYVRNTKLFRRFVMAQMFHNLNWVSYDGKYKGYNECLKRMYSYRYTFDMMLEEIRVISKLEVRDRESFAERVHFFDKNVVIAVLEDYMEKLKVYMDNLPNHKCKGVPYKRVKGINIFVDDLNKKLYWPLADKICKVKRAKNYTEIHRALSNFMRDMIKLPYDTPKSKVWIDAYKGAGAYYTCKNLIMFHDCVVFDGNRKHNNNSSMHILQYNLDKYKGEYYRMFAFMNKLIEDNGINTKTHIAEICNK